MLMRVSGKDGFKHFHVFRGSCDKKCIHGALDKATLKRVLQRVDQDRVSAEAQEEYSKFDDSKWFATVTEQLYLKAILAEGVSEADAPRALECVYSVRSTEHKEYDEDMQRFMDGLIHVKYDLTDKQIEPIMPSPEFSLHSLNGGTEHSWSDVLAASADRPFCVVAGSWS